MPTKKEIEAAKKKLAASAAAPSETALALLVQAYNEGGVYLTKEAAAEAVAAGNLAPDTSNVKGDTVLCLLTAQGASLVPKQPAVASIEIDDDVPMPVKERKGGRRGSKYPFEALEVGKSFHVPKTAEMPDPVAALASSLTGARRKFESKVADSTGAPVMEDVKVKTYKLDAKGKREKDATGSWIVAGETTVKKQKTVNTRDFFVIEAKADDKRGAGARVFRSR